MKKEVIGKCPVCGGSLAVTRLTCSKCNTNIEGNFQLSKFQLLSKEDLEFVESFIKNRGSIKAMEKEMGVSYPTVKNRLENVIEALGYKKEPVESPKPAEILEKIKSGEITPAQAVKLLNGEEIF